MHPNHTHFVVFPGPTPTVVTSPPPKRRKQKDKIYQIQFVLSIYSLERAQIPGGQPLKET